MRLVNLRLSLVANCLSNLGGIIRIVDVNAFHCRKSNVSEHNDLNMLTLVDFANKVKRIFVYL